MYIQREFVDVVDIYQRLGYRLAGLDMDYCVTVTDGTLQVDLMDYPYELSSLLSSVFCF